MKNLFTTDGLIDCVVDFDGSIVLPYVGKDVLEIHSRYGGHIIHISRSGLTVNGTVDSLNVVVANCYRTDCNATSHRNSSKLFGSTVLIYVPVRRHMDTYAIDGDKPFVALIYRADSTVALAFASELPTLAEIIRRAAKEQESDLTIEFPYYDGNLEQQTLKVAIYGHQAGRGLNYRRFVAAVIGDVVPKGEPFMELENVYDKYVVRDKFGVVTDVYTTDPRLGSAEDLRAATGYTLLYDKFGVRVAARQNSDLVDLAVYRYDDNGMHMHAMWVADAAELALYKRSVIARALVELRARRFEREIWGVIDIPDCI